MTVVHTAYNEVLSNLIFALVETGVLPPSLAAEVVRRGKATLAKYPLEDRPLIEAGHTGLERLAQQMEESGPRD